MKRFLLAALLSTACSGSLVDQAGVATAGGGNPPADSCAAVRCGVKTGSTVACVNSQCQFTACAAPNLACDSGCCQPQQISAGGNTTCAILGDTVRCFGAQLGAGTSSAIPLEVAGLRSPSKIAVGATHACAIVAGTVRCWGSNVFGELGQPASSTPSPAAAAAVSDISDAVDVAVGRDHSCALSSSRGVLCWGSNASGQLGDASGIAHAGVVQVTLAAAPVAPLSAGDAFTCVKTSGGGAQCWGADDVGQVGNGALTFSPQLPPSAVAFKSGGGGGGGGGAGGGGAVDAVAIASGSAHNCAITTVALGENVLQCWGEGRSGQLGNAASAQTSSPAKLSTFGFTQVAAGARHSCAYSPGPAPVLGEDTTPAPKGLYCWGSNDSGQLGSAPTGPGINMLPASPILATANVVQLAAGTAHTCALLDDRSLLCWGANADGEVGVPAAGFVTTPTQVTSAAPP